MSTIDFVVKILREQHGLGEQEVTGDEELALLGLDSLDIVELVIEVEEQLKIELPDDRFESNHNMTLNQFVALVDEFAPVPN